MEMTGNKGPGKSDNFFPSTWSHLFLWRPHSWRWNSYGGTSHQEGKCDFVREKRERERERKTAHTLPATKRHRRAEKWGLFCTDRKTNDYPWPQQVRLLNALFDGVPEVNTPRGKIEEQSKNPFQNTSTFMYIFSPPSPDFIAQRCLIS